MEDPTQRARYPECAGLHTEHERVTLWVGRYKLLLQDGLNQQIDSRGTGTTLWLLALSGPSPVLAKTKISPDAEIHADQKKVQEILATFEKAEAALEARNLENLMALYSKDYAYHGLTKDDIRNI